LGGGGGKTGKKKTFWGEKKNPRSPPVAIKLAEGVGLTRPGIVPPVIVGFPDFSTTSGAPQEAFQHLRFRGHDLVAFHILDPNEMDFSLAIPGAVAEDA